ncbi:MAG: cob(I)yrinic acid a,c-diamide adenosyltransferase [Candidatus Komeilibacteria bacterium]
MKQKLGQIQIYTGNGKGKTTASLGLCMRARGRNLKVAIVFFDKGGLDYGERGVLKKIGVDFWVSGCIRFNPKLKKFRFGVTPEDIKSANEGLVIAREVLSNGKYDLVVLDEINSTTNLKMLDVKDVLAVIKDKHPNTELIMTGRNAPLQFKKIANLITEMTLKKHYFYEGVEAREGIEY